MSGRTLAGLLACLLLLACAPVEDEPQEAGNRLPTGTWRAAVQVPGGELPFGLELHYTKGDGWFAYYRNGEERVRVGEVTVTDTGINLFMPAFNSRIVADLQDGVLVGRMTVIKTGAEPHVMPFRAVPGRHYRFNEMLRAPEIDVTGRWRVTFTDDEGNETPAVGIFRQSGAEVTGTFLTPLSDYRYLAGEVQGRELLLSAFDGAHVFLFKARLDENGRLNGDFWSAMKWHESWQAELDPRAELPDPETLTYIKDGYDGLAFTFPDLDGNPVSLADPRFADKVVIITLVGSWCPNCHDEAAFLAPWYRENRDRGVEVIALMFEHFGDFATAATQTREFRSKFGIEYPTLIAGISDKQEAGKMLPMLNALVAFPTTIFLDRDGKVRRIHTGFNGPGTGQRFEIFKQDFTTFIDDLLAE